MIYFTICLVMSNHHPHMPIKHLFQQFAIRHSPGSAARHPRSPLGTHQGVIPPWSGIQAARTQSLPQRTCPTLPAEQVTNHRPPVCRKKRPPVWHSTVISGLTRHVPLCNELLVYLTIYHYLPISMIIIYLPRYDLHLSTYISLP